MKAVSTSTVVKVMVSDTNFLIMEKDQVGSFFGKDSAITVLPWEEEEMTPHEVTNNNNRHDTLIRAVDAKHSHTYEDPFLGYEGKDSSPIITPELQEELDKLLESQGSYYNL